MNNNDGPDAQMLHTKFKVIGLLILEKKSFGVFLHTCIWNGDHLESCDPVTPNKLSFSLSMGATHNNLL